MSGRFDRPVERSLRLLAGLVLFGLAMALLIESQAGLDPWNVFHQGVTEHVDLTIGEVTVLSSLALLALWVPLRQRPGLGTLANALVVGPVIDLGIAWFPTAHGLATQAAFAIAAILASAVATGLYVGAGWGPGPRDGLMTGLAARGIPLGAARAAIELTVLVAGWLLGGTVGVGDRRLRARDRAARAPRAALASDQGSASSRNASSGASLPFTRAPVTASALVPSGSSARVRSPPALLAAGARRRHARLPRAAPHRGGARSRARRRRGVVEVRATGLCRSDWHGWMGHDPDDRAARTCPGTSSPAWSRRSAPRSRGVRGRATA